MSVSKRKEAPRWVRDLLVSVLSVAALAVFLWEPASAIVYHAKTGEDVLSGIGRVAGDDLMFVWPVPFAVLASLALLIRRALPLSAITLGLSIYVFAFSMFFVALNALGSLVIMNWYVLAVWYAVNGLAVYALTKRLFGRGFRLTGSCVEVTLFVSIFALSQAMMVFYGSLDPKFIGGFY